MELVDYDIFNCESPYTTGSDITRYKFKIDRDAKYLRCRVIPRYKNEFIRSGLHKLYRIDSSRVKMLVSDAEIMILLRHGSILINHPAVNLYTSYRFCWAFGKQEF